MSLTSMECVFGRQSPTAKREHELKMPPITQFVTVCGHEQRIRWSWLDTAMNTKVESLGDNLRDHLWRSRLASFQALPSTAAKH